MKIVKNMQDCFNLIHVILILFLYFSQINGSIWHNIYL